MNEFGGVKNDARHGGLAIENLRSGKSKRVLDLQGLNKAHLICVQISNWIFDDVANRKAGKYVDKFRLQMCAPMGKLITSG